MEGLFVSGSEADEADGNDVEATDEDAEGDGTNAIMDEEGVNDATDELKTVRNETEGDYYQYLAEFDTGAVENIQMYVRRVFNMDDCDEIFPDGWICSRALWIQR